MSVLGAVNVKSPNDTTCWKKQKLKKSKSGINTYRTRNGLRGSPGWRLCSLTFDTPTEQPTFQSVKVTRTRAPPAGAVETSHPFLPSIKPTALPPTRPTAPPPTKPVEARSLLSSDRCFLFQLPDHLTDQIPNLTWMDIESDPTDKPAVELTEEEGELSAMTRILL